MDKKRTKDSGIVLISVFYPRRGSVPCFCLIPYVIGSVEYDGCCWSDCVPERLNGFAIYYAHCVVYFLYAHDVVLHVHVAAV